MPDSVVHEEKACPFCSESIKVSAIKCKHCKSSLVPLSENVNNVSDTGSVHIHNTISNQPADKTKAKSYLVGPVPYVDNRKIGHGLSSIGLSVLMFGIAGAYLEDESLSEDDLFATMLSFELIFLFVASYALWIMFQEQSNKVWPVISLILSSLFMVSLLNY